MTSSTHPDPTKWYSNSDPSFSWTTNAYSQTITGYSCTLDHSPTTLPAASVTTTTANYGYTGVADGVWYFHVRAETSAGWGGAAQLKIQIDTASPTTSATGLQASATAAWQKTPAKVTLSATDNTGGSGVAHTYYTLDGGARQTYLAPFTLSDGAHTVSYWSTDKAGNTETTHKGYANIDTASPTTTATGLQASAAAAWQKTRRRSPCRPPTTPAAPGSPTPTTPSTAAPARPTRHPSPCPTAPTP